MSESFDAVVVGAGPTGLACGIELQKRGVKTVLVEKGCVVNSIYHYPTNMTFFTTPELLEIGDIPMTSLNDKPNRTEALKYYRRVADHYKLNIRQYERVDRIEGHDLAFRVHTTDKLGCTHVLDARKIVLATGYYDVPNLLNVPGEERIRIRTTTTMWPWSAPRTPPRSPRWSCGGPARASR
jgi:thioredoxin reductase (NADPH)